MTMKNYLMDLENENMKEDFKMKNFNNDYDYTYEYERDEAEDMAKRNADTIANSILTLKRTVNEINDITCYIYSVNYDYLLKMTGREKHEPLDFEMMREILDSVIDNVSDIRLKLTLEKLYERKTYVPDVLGCRIKGEPKKGKEV